MYLFIGGDSKRRPRKTLASAISACEQEQLLLKSGKLSMEARNSEITQLIYSNSGEDAGSFWFPDGTPVAFLPKDKIREIIDLVSVCLLRDSYHPPVDEQDIISGIKEIGPPIYPAVLVLTQKRLSDLAEQRATLQNRWKNSVQAHHGLTEGEQPERE